MAKQPLRFAHYDLKAQPSGAVVEVTLSCINNVRLMDSLNFGLFKAMRPHKFLGGLTKVSPTRITIPQGGHWHLVVDMDGLPALASSSVKTFLPGNLASARLMQASKANEIIAPVSNPSTLQKAVAHLVDPADITQLDDDSDDLEDMRRELDNYKRMANTDALTGLNNRRAFDLRLEALFQSAHALERTGLVIGDIDHFKKFNDTFGHPVGDLVLRGVAGVFESNLRGNTFIARTGGEEFGFIIEGANREIVFNIAERVCRAVEKAEIMDPQDGKVYGPVTISMGLCMAADAADPETLYQKSDAALYAAKRNGRNQCSSFGAGIEDIQALTG